MPNLGRAVVAMSQCRNQTETFKRKGKAVMGIQYIHLLITEATGA